MTENKKLPVETPREWHRFADKGQNSSKQGGH